MYLQGKSIFFRSQEVIIIFKIEAHNIFSWPGLKGMCKN